MPTSLSSDYSRNHAPPGDWLEDGFSSYFTTTHAQMFGAVMGLVRLRNRKMAYFDFRIRIITVCLLRMRIRRGALLKVLAFIGLRSVSVPINTHQFVRTFL